MSKRVQVKTKTIWMLAILPIIAVMAWVYKGHDSPSTAIESNVHSPKPAVAKAAVATAPVTPKSVSLSSMPSSPMVHVLNDSSLSPIERIRAIQNKTDLEQALVEEHDVFTRYPEFNKAFEAAEYDPVAKRYEIDERTTFDQNKEMSITMWADKKYYQPGDQVHVSAYISNAEGEKVASKLVGQLIFDERQALKQYEMTDNDADGIYQLDFTLDEADGLTLQEGVYKLLIISDKKDLSDAVTFTLSVLNASLTGHYRDRITAQGNLLVEAELRVDKPSRFYFQASLYSSTNDPIGSAQYSASLKAGTRWIPLEFYGLMIRDAGEPGPYILRNLSVAKAILPIQRAPLVNPEYATQGYELDQFTTQKFSQSQQDQNQLGRANL